MLSPNLSLSLLTHFSLGFFLSTALIVMLSYVARLKGILLDNPTERKRHEGRIPMVGGISIFACFTLWFFLNGLPSQFLPLYVASLWLMLVGLADDLSELSSTFRLLAQIVAAFVIVYFGQTEIISIGAIFGGEPVKLGRVSVVFSVICILGVINAINMIDGIDGLSSGITLLTLFALFIVAGGNSDPTNTLFLILLMGSISAFMLFNMGYYGRQRKVFMGDAGSTLLGILLAWFFIVLSQSDAKPLSPVVAGWLFGLPLLDSVAVMLKRLKLGLSPFKADRNHLHHQLISHGYSSRKTLVIMLSVHALMLAVGVIFNSVPQAEPYLFWLFVLLVVVRYYVFDAKAKELA